MEKETYIYYHPYDRSIPSGTLTRIGLERYLQESHKRSKNTDPDIRKEASHGKPFFARYKDIFHNVSHSGNWWVCAYGESEIGLDLQKNGRNDNRKLAKRFFHPLEYEWLLGKEPVQFYRIWAYNESYLKYTGEGLARDMKSFSVISDPEDPVNLGAPGVWQKEITFPADDYWMVLTCGQPQKVKLRKLLLENTHL